MFENIGDKIKVLAKVICIVEIIFSIIFGAICMFIGKFRIAYIFNGIIIAFIGSLIAWISIFFMYGFGQLISNSDKIVKNIEKNNLKSKDTDDSVEERLTVKQDDLIEELENNSQNNIYSEKVEIKCTCGASLSYSKEFLKGKSKLKCMMCKKEIDII